MAKGRWAMDSGGFTELSMFGEWRTSESQFVEKVYRYRNIGGLDWVSPQDWMCEPFVLAKTGLSIKEHQERTVRNYIRLQDSGLPFIPVLQGWTHDDYKRCVDMYEKAGVDLPELPLVGVGSVCRRQNTLETEIIIRSLYNMGMNLHGFGVKIAGIKRYGHILESADSMAWSFAARRSLPLPECTHKACNNCLKWALEWRKKVLEDTK